MPYVKVSFDKLIFWNKNPRIASTNAKQEEIKDAIANLNPKKLLALCRSIIEHQRLIEAPLIDSSNIVYDGNRRLTALALLNDVSFAPHSIKKAIEKLVSDNQELIKEISSKIECRQETDLNLINLIVDERHATDDDGLKQITWGPLERLRRKDPNAVILKLIEFASNNRLILPEDGFSTFERIINTKEISNKLLPLWEKKDENPTNLLKILTYIYTNIKNGNFDTRKLGKAKQVKDAILPTITEIIAKANNTETKVSGIEPAPAIIPLTTSARITSSNSGEEIPTTISSSKPSKAGVRKSTDRKHLILKNSCLPDISHLHKINDIVNELRRLNIQEFPIAGAILFRTLLELSTDHYLNCHNEADSSLKLKQKLQKAINIIQKNNKYPEDGKTLETLKNDIRNENEDVSITKLNTFVHADMLPNTQTVILQYINMEKLIAFMLSDIK